ncbi:11672_t:CDS:2, partial [Gigaspora margarita]
MSYDIASTEANTSQIALIKDNNLKKHEVSELACDNNEFEGSIDNSVVITCENSLSKKIHEGGKFQSWEEALEEITMYARQEGFGLRKGRSEKTSDGVIRKRTMLCEHSGDYKPRNKQSVRETNTKYIKCLWHINLSQPTKDNPHGIIYITTLSNAHNHNLSPDREKFFNNIEFTQEMCERVEFYVNAVKLKPLQIQKALQKEFPDYEIYLSEIYK